MRFLVVDDDHSCRELLKAILLQFGSCDVASNGSEAIRRFHSSLDEEQHYNLIFLDVVMPGISGLETLDALRHMESSYNIHGSDRTKIVIITGYHNPNAPLRDFRKDCELYMTKPFTPQQIKDTVHSFVGELTPVAMS